MKIYVAFEGAFEAFDVSTDETVAAVKLMIKDRFHIPLSEDKRGRRCLELTHAGATLQDGWSLADVGISACATLKCSAKEEGQPVFSVFNTVTRQRMAIVGDAALVDDRVARLRTLVALRCGLPVGVFCLRTPAGLELYDCNRFQDYGLAPGTTLRLDVWDGWKEFLRGCVRGQTLKVQRYLSTEGPVLRYQKRVALYVAAFHGHVELTEWSLAQGARPHEAVGAHPYREWCQDALHADVSKCPVHAAAEAGQLLILQAFVRCSPLALQCRTAAGRTPLALACAHGHLHCARFLLRTLASTVSFPRVALPMRLYIQVKRWLCRAQSRSRGQLRRARLRGARVGATVLVDGFAASPMTSRSWRGVAGEAGATPGVRLPPLRVQPGAVGQRHPRAGVLPLPPLPAAVSDARGRQPRLARAAPPPGPFPAVSGARCPHPACSSAGPDAPCAHRRRTPRDNARRCLEVASAFKEKSWFQQLEIARILARKSVSSLTARGGGLSALENPLEVVL
ncbi:protein ANKUB1 [Sorex araneus]|uniref:protein ANKUB1 n=1 Tax=Sorex araneus TaxID=42254 RepID=UPI002433946E|nr:protein ANKUB1 [Sorex araneus]